MLPCIIKVSFGNKKKHLVDKRNAYLVTTPRVDIFNEKSPLIMAGIVEHFK